MKSGIVVILVISAATIAGLLSQSGVLGQQLRPGQRPLVPKAVTKPSSTHGPGSDGDEPPAVADKDELSAGAYVSTTVLTTSPPEETTTSTVSRELSATKEFLQVVCEVQNEPEGQEIQRSGRNFRHFPLDLRERLFSALYAAERKLPQPGFQQSSRPAVKPDCHHPSLSKLLTGQRRSKPYTLVDLPSGMGGGPELDFLEIRLMEMQHVADVMVIAETGHTFRGDKKPRAYQLNKQRFEAFQDWMLYLDIEKCPQYWIGIDAAVDQDGRKQPNVWKLQNRQRECAWDMFFQARPDLPDDTLVIFSDLDEIPNAELMMSMKHCEWKTPKPDKIQFSQRRVQYNLRQVFTNEPDCIPRERWRQGGLFQLGWAKKTLQRDRHIPLRYPPGYTPEIIGGGIHLNYFGHAVSLMTKILQHGERGTLVIPDYIVPCNVTDQDVLLFLSTVRDNPITIARSFEKKSQVLKKGMPKRQDLQKCHLPWALEANPRRYAAFWGQELIEV